MRNWLRELDRVLRGEATQLSALRQGTIDVPVGRLTVLIAVLGVFYGVCMGGFAVFREGGPVWGQVLAAALKTPALFLLTLVVTFPSLYVFNALVGSRLGLDSVLRLLIAALSVTLALLASFGTIVAFFAVCTTSYAFMLLLNVLVFTVAGALGLKFLLQTLHRLSVATSPPPAPTPTESDSPDAVQADGQEDEPSAGASAPNALDPLDGRVLGPHVKAVFRCWVVLFGLVGAQMAWVLRPFVGDPGQPFTWFRARESNFFEAVWNTLCTLLS